MGHSWHTVMLPMSQSPDRRRQLGETGRQLGRFLLVGGSAFLIDAVVYFVLTRYLGVYYVLARVVSLLCALIWSFLHNRRWTFSVSHRHPHQFIRYTIVTLASSLTNIGLMKVAVDYLHIYDLVALVAITGTLAAASYLGHKFWSFRVGS